jgi:hypothetical protein
MVNTPSQGDKELPGSDRLSRVYQSGPRSEPPSRLDASILAEARKAVKPKKKGLPSPFGWGAPVSLAAVVILSVTVVLLMSREGVDPLQPVAREAARSAPESGPAKAAEPRQERKEPSAFMADKLEKKAALPPSANVAQDAAAPAAPASRAMAPEESRAGAGMAAQELSTAAVAKNAVEDACDLAVRRLAWFKDARISRKNNSRFEYEGKTFTGCVRVIDGDRSKLPPDRGAGGDFYPREGSDLAAMGWQASKEADGPDGTFYQVDRQEVFCLVEGQWDGGDDSDPAYVPASKLQITVKCARR